MKIYWTYRAERLDSPYNLWNGISLNWTYTPAPFLNNQFADWNSAWLTNVVDNIIPEDKYNWEIAPWIKKLTRFILCEYNETYVDPLELSRSLTNVGARFNIDMLNVSEAREWVRNNTSLEEVSEWKFKLSDETTSITWEVIPEQYLIIE